MANPIDEDSWIAYLDETVRTASDLEQRVNAVEMHKRAAGAEPGSLRIWLAYCDYFWSLWACSQSAESGWSDEDQMMGRELFAFGTALDLWQQGYEAVKYRLDDSHGLWDRWISLEMELLEKTKTPEGIKRITHLYRDRLLTPHLSWDDTSQKFSSFLSEYNRDGWEESMKDITSRAQDIKRLIAARDPFELALKKAIRDGNTEAQKAKMAEYLEWEMSQSRRNNDSPEIGTDLCCGLYARALTGVFETDETVWHDYIVFLSLSLSDTDETGPERRLDILRRAVQHCPWSGNLWNRYILCAEEARLPFVEIESIKHAATSSNQLYKNGMESMIEMYVAWCGFLKRRAMDASATDEAVDVADVGLSAAVEDVGVVGQRLYGKDFQGDPKFRLERIYIQYLTEKKGAIDSARAQWENLASVQIHADSYDFWFRYYMWEMVVFSAAPHINRSPTPSTIAAGFRVPAMATSVLYRAATRRKIDWPERVLEVYMQHCNDYELPATVRRANDMVHRAEKGVKKRRDLEQEEVKAAAYATYYSAQGTEQAAAAEASPMGSKRKRDSVPDVEVDAGNASKRVKSEQEAAEAHAQAGAKRDRENATIIVKNLPGDVTQTKIRQYFKAYGHINNITAMVRDEGGNTTTALIEFRSAEDAQSALLRDQKFFGQSQLSVESGYDLTVYVANFPPTANDGYIRELFTDCGEILSVRWPSLKVNTHRRFCYVSFRDRSASAKAILKEGTMLEEKYRLLAKYSDPGRKKNREGAVAEGREIHLSNLDRSLTEVEIREVFSKYGTISRVSLPQNLAGKNRGLAYLDFATTDEAELAAAEMNNVKFRNEILQVEVSKVNKVKPSARSTNLDRESASPAPSSRDAEGDEGMRDAGADDGQAKVTAAAISARTIALLGLPDTVNDARVRALVEPMGAIVQLVLQPANGGAKIEFADAATAGKAALELNSMDFEGHTLRTGTVADLRRERPEHKDDRITYGAKEQKGKKAVASTSAPSSAPAPAKGLMAPPPNMRRPALGRAGPKRGLGFAPRKAADKGANEHGEGKTNGEEVVKKSNADFKAMFLGGGKETKGDGKEKDAGGEKGGGKEQTAESKGDVEEKVATENGGA